MTGPINGNDGYEDKAWEWCKKNNQNMSFKAYEQIRNILDYPNKTPADILEEDARLNPLYVCRKSEDKDLCVRAATISRKLNDRNYVYEASQFTLKGAEFGMAAAEIMGKAGKKASWVGLGVSVSQFANDTYHSIVDGNLLKERDAVYTELTFSAIASPKFYAMLASLKDKSLEEQKQIVNAYFEKQPMFGIDKFKKMAPQYSLFLVMEKNRIMSEIEAKGLHQGPEKTDEELVAAVKAQGQSLDHANKKTAEIAEQMAKGEKQQAQYNQEVQKQLDILTQAAQANLSETRAISKLVASNALDTAEIYKWSRFMMDHMYGDLTTKEKIYAIQDGYYPQHAAKLEGLVKQYNAEMFIKRWDERAKVVDAAAKGLLVGMGLLRKVGVKVPKNAEKFVLAGQGAFHIALGLTGNPKHLIAGIQTLVGAFKKQKDIEQIRFQHLCERLDVIEKNQYKTMEMIQELGKVCVETHNLCLGIAQQVDALGREMILHYQNIMEKLTKIHTDVLVNRMLLMEIKLDKIKQLAELVDVRKREEYYHFSDGLFSDEAGMRAFFHENFKVYDEGMRDILSSFNVDVFSGHIKPVLLYHQDVADAENEQDFHQSVWLPTRAVWQSHVTNQNEVLSRLLSSFRHVDAIDQLYQDGPPDSQELSETHEFIQAHLFELLTAGTVINLCETLLEFSHYDFLLQHSAGELLSEDQLLNPNRQLTKEGKRGIRSIEKALPFVYLSIVQHNLISGIPLIRPAFACLEKKFEKSRGSISKGESQHVKLFLDLLENNRIFHRNFALYFFRKFLKYDPSARDARDVCLNYRLAYNHTTDPTSLQKFFTDQWTFTPVSGESRGGWSAQFTFQDEASEKEIKFKLRLPEPNNFAVGRLTYPYAVYQLAQVKNRLVAELTGYKLNAPQLEPRLKESLYRLLTA